MDKCLIIARYKEDLSWLENHKDFKIKVYNKGNKLIDNKYMKIENLENVGRESHTWLYHIVNNYNNLDEINIFLQGQIDDLGCMAFTNPNNYLKDIDKFGFVASRLGILGPFHWKNNIGIEKDLRYKKDWYSGKISKSKIGFRKFAKSLFPKIPLIVPTSYGGCFAVKKEIILKYQISFYEGLLNILNKNKNPIEGHYMERLWCYMFTNNSLFLKSVKDVIHTKIERSYLNKLINQIN